VPLHIYNSLTKAKELFEPIHAPFVGLYVCGPTVSGESHLGHARPYITFDVVYRYLTHLGYQVRYVRNITDAGHFEEEGRVAEDKVGGKAKLERLEPMELVQKYTNLYHDAMDALGNLRPSIEPTATGHIPEQIEMIETILSKGMAYVSNGSVYFDVLKYAANQPYGQLSGRILEDMIAGSRALEGQEEKRNAADFALWKKAPAEHIMRWNSPWGAGFPGWHIECSAMATKYLGKTFDIHGGGMDLQFPHHESEIAQSNICNDCMPVKYWMHNNMITVNGKKMGKSYNNTITLKELFTGKHPLLEKEYDPMTVRFLILQTHYRSTLDFSNEALQAAEKGLQRLLEAHKNVQEIVLNKEETAATKSLLEVDILEKIAQCENYIDDDFNTAMVLANLFELSKTINAYKNHQIDRTELSEGTIKLLQHTFTLYIETIMGLKMSTNADNGKLEEVMQTIIRLRQNAKATKDFATSDAIRKELQLAGIQLKDEKDGTVSWSTL